MTLLHDVLDGSDENTNFQSDIKKDKCFFFRFFLLPWIFVRKICYEMYIGHCSANFRSAISCCPDTRISRQSGPHMHEKLFCIYPVSWITWKANSNFESEAKNGGL